MNFPFSHIGASITLSSLLAVHSVAHATSSHKIPWNAGEYEVIKVSDGDTFKVRINGRAQAIRVLGLDTPEKFTTRTGYKECYGIEASRAATKLLLGKMVRITPDATQNYRDNYDRILAHVHLPGGKLFAEEMIQEGYGLRYIYKNKPTIYDTQLQRAEVLAQNNNRGIWNICQGIRKRVNSIF